VLIEEQAMLKTNHEKLVKISVIGEIASPMIRSPYTVSATENPLFFRELEVSHTMLESATWHAVGKPIM